MRVYQFRHIRADGQCSHLFPEISCHGCLSAERCRRSLSESMTSPPAHGDGRTIFLIDGWSAYRRSLRLFVEAAGYRVVGEADSISAAAAHVGLAAADVVILDPGWESAGASGPISRGFAMPTMRSPLSCSRRRHSRRTSRGRLTGPASDAQLTKEASPEEILATVAIALRGNLIVLSRGHPLALGATEPDSSGARDPDARRSGIPQPRHRPDSVGRRAIRSLPSRERVPQARRPGPCRRGATGGGLWAP